MPVGVHLSKFLLDGAERVRALVIPLLLRLAAICACASIRRENDGSCNSGLENKQIL